MALTPGQERFADKVHLATGLELPTVRAWVAAEGGPDDNPLNIMGWRDGQRHVRRFGTPDAAAAETISLLRTERYRPIIVAAGSANVDRELAAIAASPWEERNYRGRTQTPGTLLLGAFKALYPGNGATLASLPLAPGGFTPIPEAPGIGRRAVAKGLGALGWKEWAVAFSLYALFTVAALALMAVGLARMLGVSPAALATQRAQPKSAQTDDIPF